jgi:hypothetical protein
MLKKPAKLLKALKRKKAKLEEGETLLVKKPRLKKATTSTSTPSILKSSVESLIPILLLE